MTHYLLVHSFMQAEEPLVLNADNYSTALNICSRKLQRAEVAEDDAMDAAFSKAFESPVSVNPISVKKNGSVP
jgi:hypothetical protein